MDRKILTFFSPFFLILRKNIETFTKHIPDEVNFAERKRLRNSICHGELQKQLFLFFFFFLSNSKFLGFCMKNTDIEHTSIKTTIEHILQ